MMERWPDNSRAAFAGAIAAGADCIETGLPKAQSVGVIDPGRLADLLCRSPDAVMLNDPGMAPGLALRLPLRAIRQNLSTPPKPGVLR
jgi:hypothetical protein